MVYRDGANETARQVGRVEVTNMCRRVFNQATINCPVDTGNLRAQHRMRVKDLKTMVKGEVINGAKYAAAVHDGSKSHTITARKKKALRFKIGGRTVLVRSVRHPGTKPRPWLRTAAETVSARYGWRFERKQAKSSG